MRRASSQNRGRKGNGTSMEHSTENSLASTGQFHSFFLLNADCHSHPRSEVSLNCQVPDLRAKHHFSIPH
jgi:hypothetical protein